MKNKWLVGARLKTLPAAIVPVLVGTAGANRDLLNKSISLNLFVYALLVALFLQVGVNYANDYSDGIKGTDKNRVGPTRLVASGLADAESVKRAALICFLLAAIFGTLISIATSYWFLLVGALSILAAWGYTGGKKPYGYFGLGEIFVFIFFGVVATTGSYLIQTMSLSWFSIFISFPVGLLACALLAINNLRDLNTDGKSGKKTLAVRLGEKRAKNLYLYLLYFAHLTAMLIAPITLILVIRTMQMAKDLRSKDYQTKLIALLADTARLQMLFGLIISVTIFLAK
jgi:1,4-dihydroxy-2-naphthoate octaprenyltransferase